ncbi:hypothetical protein FGO68_gene9331 [Halteria grandinella]|uniref:Uncharacterized protein n=1 Tax=Halteria grandinella TaxID=5974 RepID=A0A8J8NAC4_HALGN|nr:hypothetical protein FGO68_gene9331 [Halteria grandinella]
MISSPTSFKLTMNLPTVTYFSAFLTNFKCYLTPFPLISVSGPVNGPNSNLHSPNNLACPQLSSSGPRPYSRSVTTYASNQVIISCTCKQSLMSNLKLESGIMNQLAANTGAAT